MDLPEDSYPLAHRLDLTSRDFFRSKVRDNLFSSVCPSSPYHGFSLVISLGRANFNLNNINVGLALSACLGDPYDSFRVACLRDRVYIFYVDSKAVGFMICNLRSYTCKDSVCYFHLWTNGGPNWEREEKHWYSEQDKEWTMVQSKTTRPQQSREQGNPHGFNSYEKMRSNLLEHPHSLEAPGA
jgi:hypothetical protein